jgi:hypothetical protein
MLCSNLLTGLIAVILSLSLSCDSYGKNSVSRKGCEMATQDDDDRQDDDDVPLPRSRPYNPDLPPNDPGNQRAIRADLQPILEAFGNWGKALERQEQEGQQERNRRYQPHQPLPNPLGFAQGGRLPEMQSDRDYHGGYHGGNEPPLCPCREYEPITLIFLSMNLGMYGPGKDYEES